MENEEHKVVLNYAKPDLDSSTFLIAYIHKIVIYGLFVTLFLVIFSIALNETDNVPSFFVFSIGMLTYFGTSLFAVRLSMYVYPYRIEGLLIGVLSLIPLIGFLAIFIINRRASQLLIDRGLKVGIFGADLNDARRLEAAVPTPDTSPPKG
jgi:hypothetical protein